MSEAENSKLTICGDCSGKVSINAAACPHCGAPAERFQAAMPQENIEASVPTEQAQQDEPRSDKKYSLPGIRPESVFNRKTIDLVKVDKRKGLFYPIVSAINIIGYLIAMIIVLIVASLVFSATQSWVWTLLAAIVAVGFWGAFCIEPLILFAENRVYDVEIVFEDGETLRQSDGSASTRALPWHEFFFNAAELYAQQRELSETEFKIKAQSFLTLSEIKSRKVNFN